MLIIKKIWSKTYHGHTHNNLEITEEFDGRCCYQSDLLEDKLSGAGPRSDKKF